MIKNVFSNFFVLIILLGLTYCGTPESPKQEDTHPKKPRINSDEINKKLKDETVFRQLTIEALDKIKDGNLVQAIMDNISAKMRVDRSNELDVLERLTEERKAIYAVKIIEGEIINGGFYELYSGVKPEITALATKGFAAIGAKKFAKLMEEANTFNDALQEKIANTSEDSLELIVDGYENNPYHKFDDKFYDLYELEDLNDLQIKFIRKNKEAFKDAKIVESAPN